MEHILSNSGFPEIEFEPTENNDINVDNNYEDEVVDCICEEAYRMVEVGFMIDCDKCHTWYHAECVNQNQDSMPSFWVCPRCTGQFPANDNSFQMPPSPNLVSSPELEDDLAPSNEEMEIVLPNPKKASPPNTKTQAKQPKKRTSEEGPSLWAQQAVGAKQTSLTNFPMKSFNVEDSIKQMEKENKVNPPKPKPSERVLSQHHFNLDQFSTDDLDLNTYEGKVEYARRMRLAVSNPEMLDDKGNLSQEYFKPQKKMKKLEKWGDAQKYSLLQGIQKFGIGSWKEIKDTYSTELGRLELNDLRVKCCHLIGRQNLADYKGWKPTTQELKLEKEANESLGKELGFWKGGVLVADDAGLVVKRIAEAGGILSKAQ